MKDIEFRRKKLIHNIKNEIRNKECSRCRSKEWKIIPLFEYGDVYFPSSVQILCRHCGAHFTFMDTDDKKSNEFLKSIKKINFNFDNTKKNSIIDRLIL